MIPVWPSDLPDRFDRSGFTAELGDGRLRSKTTLGPGKARLRSRAVPSPLSGKMTMRRAQLLRFLDFFDDDIAGGARPFLFPNPMGGAAILVAWGEAMPKWSNLAGDWWQLALDLEKLWTGNLDPGLPELPAGYAYLTYNGIYVLSDRVPVIVQVPA